MKYLLDTNVLSDFARGNQGVVGRLRAEAPNELAVSVVTEMEIEFGLARNPLTASRIRTAMHELLNTIQVLPLEREDARSAALIRATLANTGRPIGAYDVLLAATAQRRGLVMVTHNQGEFVRVSALTLEDWRT